jgi:glycosyltransferase involved in cell wall biosynthesis
MILRAHMVRPPEILVFAHVPPPHHGQSLMIQGMLDGLRASGWASAGASAGAPGRVRGIIHHVDARVSSGLEDVGGIRPGKFFRLLAHCLKALSIRFRTRARTLYFVPAPSKRSAILRDLLVLLVLRPRFPRVVLHWHALGSGNWAAHGETLDRRPLFGVLEPVVRAVTRRLLGGAHLSIALAPDGEAEARLLGPREVILIPNGLPDPCPHYDHALRANRDLRAAELRAGVPGTVRVLYLAACTAEKGIFDALDAFAALGPLLPAGRRAEFTIAGTFLSESERHRFDRALAGHIRTGALVDGAVRMAGQLDPDAKARAYADHDCLVVASHRESFGLTLLEAMAFGLEIAASDLPSFRAILGPLAANRIGSPKAGEPASAALARAIAAVLAAPEPGALRARYVAGFGFDDWASRIEAALHRAASDTPDAA